MLPVPREPNLLPWRRVSLALSLETLLSIRRVVAADNVPDDIGNRVLAIISRTQPVNPDLALWATSNTPQHVARVLLVEVRQAIAWHILPRDLK